ncbi:DEAD/DEAH box helicase, partial [Patescibacteria group bacterium]|nr:DEAD/DEAH box helicase [Patescibacteria group bacterium]
MNPIELSRDIEERYRRYLKTTFYFKEPDLRASFEEALNSGYLSKGPYLEATSVFKRGQTPRKLFTHLLGSQPDDGFLKAIDGDRPLYRHQEQAIEGVLHESNIIVTTGTGSGKTEAFLYPILLHLYREFQEGKLSPGVRALILYPMNALANDQRDRLGEISERLKKEQSSFRFTFGQYIGETPEDEKDSWRNARDHMVKRLPGELVLRSEMRKTPPHILLTNYSMLEYLLLRPDDSPLFDNGQARWWKFFVLDEAHQYRGSRGIEMAMLLRRLKQRLKEGGRFEPFRCIATSATLVGGEEGDKVAVAKFASDLFGEEFHKEDVILGETDPIREGGSDSLSLDEYRFFGDVIREKKEETRGRVAELATKFGISFSQNEDLARIISELLQRDRRATNLRQLITSNPTEAAEIAAQIFADLQDNERLPALSELVELLLKVKDFVSNAPLLSARYHLFLRSIEGAFVSYWPQKKVLLDRRTQDSQGIAFEVALCRECGQHYFVGPKDFKEGKLVEAIRDPSHVGFGATFFRPIEGTVEEDDEDDGKATNSKQVFQLCVRCGEMGKSKPKCGHSSLIHVVRGESPKDEDRADQMAKCGACGYNAAGRDPVREVVHGSDGPHAVIATALYQTLPIGRKKVLAFADGRQEAAFFAWYLEDSYKDILSRNLILKITKSFTQYPTEGISLSTIADRAFKQYQKAFKQKESDDEPTIRKNIWRALYREFLTDEQRLSLEGVGLVRWSINWPNWFKIPGILKSSPWSLTEQEAYDVVFILLNSMRTDMAAELQTENGVSLNWSDLGLQTSQRCISSVENGRLRFGERKWAGVTGKRIKFLIKLLYSLPK